MRESKCESVRKDREILHQTCLSCTARYISSSVSPLFSLFIIFLNFIVAATAIMLKKEFAAFVMK